LAAERVPGLPNRQPTPDRPSRSRSFSRILRTFTGCFCRDCYPKLIKKLASRPRAARTRLRRTPPWVTISGGPHHGWRSRQISSPATMNSKAMAPTSTRAGYTPGVLD
jgi:hypothetical protein